ncbi:MAG TPA: efflux RND transporter permease subunit, partial [Armatimonadetes bacterium]|nr:efflux RND transporter permease subunit [Armatimonadota bacterium]
IQAVKARLEQLKSSLPEGVEIVTTYDRSGLIQRAVDTLSVKLVEEMIVVALVSLLFLFHLRSALVAVIALPLGILGSFIIMKEMGISANIMSLGGIAIAIGAMVDAAIVMIENAHKHLERYEHEHGHRPVGAEHWRVIGEATRQVGPALFVSLLIITLSFLPVFALEGQEGRLFSPLAYTKTFAMAVAAGLSITLVPVLMGYWIRGRIVSEAKNPLNRFLVWLYKPCIRVTLRWPVALVTLMLALLVSVWYPWQKIGSEFMPALEEGDLLYMPTTLPSVSIAEARRILQITDALIKTIPEVERVFGKVGRAETATDPAPLTMIETTIQLKDKSEWRDGMTLDKLIKELNQTVRLPGLTNAWVQPIKTRIDMLSTGIKTPLGIKISGDNLAKIEATGKAVEAAMTKMPATLSAYAERSEGGRYIDIVPNRHQAAQYNLSMAQLSQIIQSAVGGKVLAQTLEGRERYSMNLRYPQVWRDSVQALRHLPIVTASGAQIQLGMVADIQVRLGPPMIKSENARLTGWVFVDLVKGTDILAYVEEAKQQVAESVELPPGVSLQWTGQYEYLLKAQKTLQQIVPMAILIIFLLLYFIFKDVTEALMILLVVPFALLGSVWSVWWLGFDYSVAVAVGKG